jgi:hypothetical protein
MEYTGHHQIYLIRYVSFNVLIVEFVTEKQESVHVVLNFYSKDTCYYIFFSMKNTNSEDKVIMVVDFIYC